MQNYADAPQLMRTDLDLDRGIKNSLSVVILSGLYQHRRMSVTVTTACLTNGVDQL
jgi:hypothetical protein